MLIRRQVSRTKFERADRHSMATFGTTFQWVQVDPWETDDCLPLIELACIAGHGSLLPEGWNHIPNGELILPPEQKMICVILDEEEGFAYFRRPIDMERQRKWHADRSFRVTKDEWRGDLPATAAPT